jgi:hypothetical protein
MTWSRTAYPPAISKVAQLADAHIAVAIRERVAFPRALVAFPRALIEHEEGETEDSLCCLDVPKTVIFISRRDYVRFW